MTETSWNADNTITEVDLARQVKLGAVTGMAIRQTPLGYQVIIQVKWHPQPIALRTRRMTSEPRLFKSLERLVGHIRKNYPTMRRLTIEFLAGNPDSSKRKAPTGGQ